MKRNAVIKSPLLTGTLMLTCAGTASKIIGFFYKIFLSRTIGAEALGIYQLIFPVFAFSLSICCLGIQTAISRFCAADEQEGAARLYLFTGTLLALFLSVVSASAIWIFSPQISMLILDEPRCAPLLRIMAPAIPFAALHSCINGFYYGRRKAAVPAASQLIEQIARVSGVCILFAVLAEEGRSPGAASAVWGILIGETASSLFSLTMLGTCRFSGQIRTAFSRLCSMAVPLTANRISLSLAQMLENILIPAALKSFGYSTVDALSIYGILTGVVLSTVMMPAVLSNSLAVMILPEISKAQAGGQRAHIRRMIRKSAAASSVLGLVCTSGFLIFSDFIGNQLFHNSLAGFYLQNLCWICPFLFLSSTLNSVLQGLGRPGSVLAVNLTGSTVRIFFIILIVPVLGMRGYLWGILASQAAVCTLALLRLRKL